jgi:type I restriction enzyme S subunit
MTELKAKLLLPIPIPIPPLEDQRSLVARIEELAAKIEEARGLRSQAVNEVKLLRASSAKTIFAELAQASILDKAFKGEL